MVNIDDLRQLIARHISNAFGNNVAFLIGCGSLGRGNFKEDWSDLDVLLVLRDIDLEALTIVNQLVEVIQNETNLETDIAVMSELDLQKGSVYKLPDKFINYMYFIDQESVILGNEKLFRRMSKEEYLTACRMHILDRKRGVEKLIVSGISKPDMHIKLLTRSVKILFLILRKISADEHVQPNTYDEAVEQVIARDLPFNVDRLKLLAGIRDIGLAGIKAMTNEERLSLLAKCYDSLNEICNYHTSQNE